MFLLISWRWVRNVVAVIATTRIAAITITPTLPPLFRNVSLMGIVPNSLLLPKDSARSSLRNPWALPCLAAWSSIRNSARKIGICTRIGRQEANGLVPVSLYSAIVSAASRSRSWPYFFCSSLTLGWISCMLRLDLICLTNNGISIARTTSVRPMIDSAQVPPASGSSPSSVKSQCQPTMIADTA